MGTTDRNSKSFSHLDFDKSMLWLKAEGRSGYIRYDGNDIQLIIIHFSIPTHSHFTFPSVVVPCLLCRISFFQQKKKFVCRFALSHHLLADHASFAAVYSCFVSSDFQQTTIFPFVSRFAIHPANMPVPSYGAAPISKLFLLVRIMQVLAMIIIIGITANFIGNIVSTGIEPPKEFVGTISVACLSLHPFPPAQD